MQASKQASNPDSSEGGLSDAGGSRSAEQAQQDLEKDGQHAARNMRYHMPFGQ